MLTNDISINRILAGLPERERQFVLPACESVDVNLGETFGEAGTPLQFIHFPMSSAISMTAMQDHEHMVDVTLTGREGSSGSSAVLGDSRSPCTAMVQIPGTAIRIPISTVMNQLSCLPYLEAALSRHNLLLMRTAVISVGCSQYHSVAQGVARWLKAHWFRSAIESFPFSPQFLAAQVGADPKSVADTLQAFQNNKLIATGCNKVTIVDHEGLGKQACECYELARQATNEYLAALDGIARSHANG
jgi:CRP-like cAMP-binding protein